MSSIVSPPNEAWSLDFAKESQIIKQALGSLSFELHHIGSTAIPGIWAKPIIDMLLVVPALSELDACSENLIDVGYEGKGEFGILGRRYFRKTTSTGIRTHHLHAFATESDHVLRHLAFRDYLNAHSVAAQAYSNLKQKLAAAHPGDMEAYIAGKDGFIKLNEALAISWFKTKWSI